MQNIVGISNHDVALDFCENGFEETPFLFYFVTSIKVIKIRNGARSVLGSIKVQVKVDKKILSFYARNRRGENEISERIIT